ncbi:MAG: LysM peptidoglycan-binding domain-containing protein [Nitrospira sp.]|nr:LysM peptidoglycan-binding domain-containing protein [Nitrospira sp.]
MGRWRNTFIGLFLIGMSACSPLEPIITKEPEMSDLQLTVDTLKTSLRDTQRMVAELRAEGDARRQELADVQVARAQLEGRIREAEHRLTEARHVIDLQREELSSARSEREQVGRTRAALQNQLKQLQMQVSKVEKPVKGNMSLVAMASPKGGQLELAIAHLQQDALVGTLEERTRVVPEPAIQVSRASTVGEAPVGSQSSTVPSRSHMLVKSGDTLWSIARRYHTSVRRLMVLNALPSDRIQAGQALWLTEPSTEEVEHQRM